MSENYTTLIPELFYRVFYIYHVRLIASWHDDDDIDLVPTEELYSAIMDYSFLHFSLDRLGLSSIPGLEVGGYLDSMLNNIPTIYYVTVASSFLLVGLSYFLRMETKRSHLESQ